MSEMTFDTICKELRIAIYSSGIPRMKSRFRTEDVIQECVVQILDQIQKEGRNIAEINLSFIRKIAIGHLCRLHRYNLAGKRNINREEVHSRCSSIRSSWEQPDELFDKHEQACAMLDSLDRLPSCEKEIIVRRFFEEESYEAIAEALDLTVYATRKLYRLALSRMRRLIESHV